MQDQATENTVGNLLRNRRKALGKTQEEVALDAGICTFQYQRYEYGIRDLNNCPMRIGLRLRSVLGLDPYALLYDSKNFCATADDERILNR